MIKFQNLRYKNFLSSGNYWTEIKLDQNTSTLIVGHNGAGKSTILDALTFVLFNKPFRKVNKNQLINTINEKDCLVEIEFTVSGKPYSIKRGMKPNLFEIYREGVLLDQAASSNDQQKWLEQSLLKLNYKSFTQIVILGSSNFVPFMQLSSQHRREVVEDLLDIKVFSTMNDVAKIKIKELRDEIKEYVYKKENLEDKIDSQNNFIEEIKKRKSKDIEGKKGKIVSLGTEIDDLIEDNNNIQHQVIEKNNSLEDLSYSETMLSKLEKLNAKIEQKISTLIEEHKFFAKNRVCPTCTQNIEEEFRLNKIAGIEDKAKEVQQGQKELQQSIEVETQKQTDFLTLSREVTQLNNEINFNNVKISGLRKQIKEFESEIQTLASQNQDTDTEYAKLKSLQESLDTILEDTSNKKEELQNYEFINLLLKDDGAKSKIIKKYLPVINSNLNKYLEILDFPVNFTLDEEFNEKALNPIYEDFSYSSFSEGEKMRIDLALLFTWREVAKVKNSINTNLLILDEVFDSSLDEAGTDYFTKIIKFVVKDSNTFVISHKVEDLLEKFDETIKFEKKKGFSMMVDADWSEWYDVDWQIINFVMFGPEDERNCMPPWGHSDLEYMVNTLNINMSEDTNKNGFWKYNEDKTLKEIEQYLSSTYHAHYTSEQSKTQTLDLIESIGDAEPFTRSNAIKYLSRFGKKNGKSKMDILKAIHYCILLYHFAGLHNETKSTYETF